LDLRRPHDNQEWFWGPLRASGLHDLVYTGYAIVPHALLMILCERWHTETNSFHMPLGQMIVTLDDVACLMHVSIEGRMLSHPKKMSRADGVDLMVRHFGVTQAEAVKNCNEEYCGYISYKALREYYEGYLDAATRLSDLENPGDPHELERVRIACVKSYLLYLVGCLLFGDKSNKHIELVYLTTMEDGYAGMHNYSWGGMTLAYLYHYLSEVSLPVSGALGRSVTLHTVRNCHI
jgi:hypothetical protein